MTVKAWFAFIFRSFLKASNRNMSCQSSSLGISKEFDYFNSGKLHEGQEILLALLSYQTASGVLFACQLKLTKTFVLTWQNKLIAFSLKDRQNF